MGEFKSYRSYQHFALSVTRHWRYSRSADQSEFLQAVLATSISRREPIPAGAKLWRAQLGNDWSDEDFGGGVVEQVPSPLRPDRMQPASDRASEGRANPKGIPCLHAATHQETAIAEVRPWIGMHVSIAQFELKRDVHVINCVQDDHRMMVYNYEPEPEERERRVWQDIDRAFSQPVTRSDDLADYAPTQVIAEFFRENGLDGVAYGSSLGPGHNVALFDIQVAGLINCGLVEIQKVKLDFKFAANPYSMQAASAPTEDGA